QIARTPRKAMMSVPRRNPRSPPRSSRPAVSPMRILQTASMAACRKPAQLLAWRAPRRRLSVTAMNRLSWMTAAALVLASPADAIVGGAAPSTEALSRTIVTIVGSRGNFCSGALIAPTLVLTVAHCVQGGAEYKIVEYGADRRPQLRDVINVATHPQFNMQAMLAHRATADVALLQLTSRAKEGIAVLGTPQLP